MGRWAMIGSIGCITPEIIAKYGGVAINDKSSNANGVPPILKHADCWSTFWLLSLPNPGDWIVLQVKRNVKKLEKDENHLKYIEFRIHVLVSAHTYRINVVLSSSTTNC